MKQVQIAFLYLDSPQSGPPIPLLIFLECPDFLLWFFPRPPRPPPLEFLGDEVFVVVEF